jgi:hypothetical protein
MAPSGSLLSSVNTQSSERQFTEKSAVGASLPGGRVGSVTVTVLVTEVSAPSLSVTVKMTLWSRPRERVIGFWLGVVPVASPSVAVTVPSWSLLWPVKLQAESVHR